MRRRWKLQSLNDLPRLPTQPTLRVPDGAPVLMPCANKGTHWQQHASKSKMKRQSSGNTQTNSAFLMVSAMFCDQCFRGFLSLNKPKMTPKTNPDRTPKRPFFKLWGQ